MAPKPKEPSVGRKSVRKIIVVDEFDHIPGMDKPTIAGNHVQITDNQVAITGWSLVNSLKGQPPRRASFDDDGISHYLPKGARLFLPTSDIKNLEKAEDTRQQSSKTKEHKGSKRKRKGSVSSEVDKTNVYVYDDSIWTINPDEPLLEESSYQYDRSRKVFLVFFTISILIASLILTLVYIWVFCYGGGIIPNTSISNATDRTTDEMKKYYNIHTIVTMSSVFSLHFENILIFRVFPHVSKFRLKCIHATTAFIGAVGMIVALVFSILGHKAKGEPSFTSVHGCIGIMTMALYEFQFLLGFSIFLLPYAPLRVRAQFVPVHKFFGGMTFLCGVTSVVTGIVVIIKVFIPLKIHSKLPLQSMMLNAVGILTVFFGLVITFLISDHHFRRRPRPELHMSMDSDKHGKGEEKNVEDAGGRSGDGVESKVVE